MSILASGKRLGDIDEPTCTLNVTVGHLEDMLCNIDNLDEAEFYDLADAELFELLHRALYGDNDRSSTEIVADAVKYRKFDFSHERRRVLRPHEVVLGGSRRAAPPRLQ
jgi:hypothetical protein